MIIKLFGPFEKIAEKEVSIKLESPISVLEILQMLATRYPGFVPLSTVKTDTELSLHVLLIRNGTVLKLREKVEDKDDISILLPVDGG